VLYVFVTTVDRDIGFRDKNTFWAKIDENGRHKWSQHLVHSIPKKEGTYLLMYVQTVVCISLPKGTIGTGMKMSAPSFVRFWLMYISETQSRLYELVFYVTSRQTMIT
jgi:hypothetical protein